jgi:hypothetical protein
MSKHMTPRALAANRANARKSTGPRTPEGKQKSAMNAVTHGIMARPVVPPSLEPYEDRAAYDRLLAALHAQWAPAGEVESTLIDTIASCRWRLDRFARAEGGAIAQAQERALAANRRRAELLDALVEDADAIRAAPEKKPNEPICPASRPPRRPSSPSAKRACARQGANGRPTDPLASSWFPLRPGAV